MSLHMHQLPFLMILEWGHRETCTALIFCPSKNRICYLSIVLFDILLPRLEISVFCQRDINKNIYSVLTYSWCHGSTKAFDRSSSNTDDNCYSAYYGRHVMSVIYLCFSEQLRSRPKCVIDVLYKRHVLGEPQRHLPTTLDSENSNIRLLDSEKSDKKVSLCLKIYDVTGQVNDR